MTVMTKLDQSASSDLITNTSGFPDLINPPTTLQGQIMSAETRLGEAMHSSATNVYRQRLSRIGAVNLGRSLLVVALLVLGAQAAQAAVDCEGTTCKCEKNQNNNDNATLYTDGAPFFQPGSAPDLWVTWECIVPTNKSYYFKNVNILDGGSLVFYEGDQGGTTTHFWASAIIIESGGQLVAYGNYPDPGNNDPNKKIWQAFGFRGGVLTFHLWGKNEAIWNREKQLFEKQNQGTPCKSVRCGIPLDIWKSNGEGATEQVIYRDSNGNPVSDYFYQYGPLYGDGQCSDGTIFDPATADPNTGNCKSGAKVGYFGNKVLAVSYGGTLALLGYKGAYYKFDPAPFVLTTQIVIPYTPVAAG